MITAAAGRQAVQRARWFSLLFCSALGVLLVAGVAARLNIAPGAVLYGWLGWQPTASTLVLEMVMLGGGVVLFLTSGWFLQLTLADEEN